MKYAELHCRSAFSFLEGGSLPEALTNIAAGMDIPAVALLDRDGFYGSPRFHMSAQKAGLRAHVGAEVTVRNEGDAGSIANEAGTDRKNGAECHAADRTTLDALNVTRYPLLCESRAGYQNLCRLLTRTKLRVAKHAESSATMEELAEHASGLVCLTGDERGPLVQALEQGGASAGRELLVKLKDVFGGKNVYVELQRHFDRRQEARNHAAIGLARELKLPLLATNGV
ncbi:MAG: PHP domain-containing protein, partial [Terriglobales bacterium]